MGTSCSSMTRRASLSAALHNTTGNTCCITCVHGFFLDWKTIKIIYQFGHLHFQYPQNREVKARLYSIEPFLCFTHTICISVSGRERAR